MENKQIAWIVLLMLFIVFILMICYKLSSALTFKNNILPLQNTIRIFSLYINEQIINLENKRYKQMRLTKDQITYYNKNKEQLVYKFQTDQNKNWKFCKYLEKDGKIIIYNKHSDTQFRTVATQKELVYFSDIEMEKSNIYYYNQLITKRALDEGDISVLDAFVMYLNQKNWENFIQTDFKKIDILFLPSYILDENQKQNKNTEQRYKEFLFYFQPIVEKIHILFERLFFITINIQKKSVILIEANFEEKIFKIHSTSGEEKNQDYIEQCNKLKVIINNSTDQQWNEFHAICPICQQKKNSKKLDYYDGCFLAYKYNLGPNQQKFPTVEELKNHIKSQLLFV